MEHVPLITPASAMTFLADAYEEHADRLEVLLQFLPEPAQRLATADHHWATESARAWRKAAALALRGPTPTGTP